jgi:hypothetical protein
MSGSPMTATAPFAIPQRCTLKPHSNYTDKKNSNQINAAKPSRYYLSSVSVGSFCRTRSICARQSDSAIFTTNCMLTGLIWEGHRVALARTGQRVACEIAKTYEPFDIYFWGHAFCSASPSPFSFFFGCVPGIQGCSRPQILCFPLSALIATAECYRCRLQEYFSWHFCVRAGPRGSEGS